MILLKRIFAPLWKTWFILVFLSIFIILYPLFFITIKTQKLKTAFKLKRIWSYGIAYGTGIIPHISYQSIQRLPQPCVIVANHTSYLDIILSTLYIDHLALFMGKAELLKVPLLNIFFKGMDIPVNRSSRVNAHKAFIKAAEELDKNHSIIIYPEGTIPTNPEKMIPFKNGAFKLAIEKQVPILPVVHLNNWHLLQNGGFFKSNGCFGIAKIIVLDAIETKGMDDNNVEDLKKTVYNVINSKLVAYYGTKN